MKRNVYGLSVVLFLNNLSPIAMDYFVADADYSFATGARVSVHAQDTLPDMRRAAVTASPGVETTLAVNQIRRIRLSEPWAICTDTQYVRGETEENGKRIRYTSDSCFDLCAQAQIIDDCGCVSASWSSTDVELRRANFTMCANQTSDSEQFSNLLDSKDSFSKVLCCLRAKDYWGACDCELPCDEIIYDVDSVSSSGLWPHKSYLLAFYHTYLNGTSSGDKIHKYAKNTNTSVWKLVGENFLQLKVVLKRTFPTIVEDKPVMNSVTLWSNIGGILTIWLGLSVMFVVEIVELVVCIVRDSVFRKPQDSGGS